MAFNENPQLDSHVVDIMGRKAIWFGISIAYLVPSIIAIFLCLQHFGAPVKLGIEFTGGTLMQVTYKQPEKFSAVRAALQKDGIQAKVESSTDFKTFNIRSPFMGKDKSIAVKKSLEQLGPVDEKHFSLDSVGPTVGKQLLQNAAMALGIGVLGILMFITFRYQFDFALSAIIAMVHDGLVMVGTFAILSLAVGAEANSLLVVALLTIMGFSVHDTIVVFDRFRENLKFAKKGDTFADVANRSVNQTFARSINTSLTVILTLLPLVIFGGHTIFFFTFVMLIGVISGTYSSIFNASPILVLIRDRGRSKSNQSAANSIA